MDDKLTLYRQQVLTSLNFLNVFHLFVYFVSSDLGPVGAHCDVKAALWSFLVNKQKLCLHSVLLTRTHGVYP